MENCKLSQELVVDILARLRVKSLMRFKCVCKFLYDLITSDRHFQHKHYGISKAKTDRVLLEVGYDTREYYLLYKESEIECIYLDIPIIPSAQWVKCCQGMLCLISTRKDMINLGPGDDLIYDILIWNPSTRKIKAIGPITVPYKLSNYPAYAINEFGFGICNNMTWKVIMRLEIHSLYGDGRDIVDYITMVYSQVRGDSWSLSQTNSPLSFYTFQWEHCLEGISEDFYLKGRYYWGYKSPSNDPYLLWFDMDEEVFGTIELPSNVIIASFTIMNETIALLGYSTVGDSNCIEIWLMIENDNNTYWHKQAIIDCVVNVDNNERWRALGIWNVDNELLVFLDTTLHWDPFFDEMEVPYFISIDLVTQERKMFFISKERQSITVASDQVDGYVQVYNERNNTDITEEWKLNCFMREGIYARVYGESLHSL
nr:putative F-box protein At1g19160 [Ipomoea batatas]